MTNDEAIAYFKRHIDLYCVDGICREAEETAIKALEQQPCDDAISRDAVRKILEKYHLGESRIAEELNELPPVTPQQKYGKWIIIDDCEQFIAKCSECGRIEDSRMISKYPYCHCGAKMQESEE